MMVEGTTALVTGANRGLGRELVQQLVDRGAAKVYAAGRDMGRLAALQDAYPGCVTPLTLDVTSPIDVVHAIKVASDVELLINNAGVLSFGGPLDVQRSAFERDLAVNFYGPLELTRAFTDVLARNSGTVVNVLTLLSFISVPGFAAYNVSKAASWSMAMSLRPELARRGIQVVNVFPAGIDTDMLRGVEAPKDSPAAVARDIIAGLQNGDEDVYPASAHSIFAAWRENHKAVERMFAGD